MQPEMPEQLANVPEAVKGYRRFEQVTYVTDEMPVGSAVLRDTWASRKELLEWQDWATVYEFQGGSWWKKVGWIDYDAALATEKKPPNESVQYRERPDQGGAGAGHRDAGGHPRRVRRGVRDRGLPGGDAESGATAERTARPEGAEGSGARRGGRAGREKDCMIEELFPDRSVYDGVLADGCVPTFGYSWGDGEDDPEIGLSVGWCDRRKKHQPFICVDLYWRTLQVGWLFS